MYKTSAQLKREAKDALRGNWGKAIVLNIIPSILQIITIWLAVLGIIAVVALFVLGFGASTNKDFSSSNPNVEQYDDGEFDDEYNFDDDNDYSSPASAIAAATAASASSSSFGSQIFSWVWSLFLSFLSIGIIFTFLDLIRNPRLEIRPMANAFRIFNGRDFVPVLLIQIISSIFVTLWSFLFVIPGIIKGYSYSQAFFIYKDIKSNPSYDESLSALNYITESRLLMKGHKGRLFYIDLSFIGWYLLSGLTLGIGFLFLNPYMNATKAAFYNDLAKDRYLGTDDPAELVMEDEEWPED